jgi:aspartyl-tRNA(Asn)/glutamyl-tRNA(Gln) amidotransferase subunit A
MSILNYSISELHALLSDKKISPVELTDAYLAQIEKCDGEIGAYISVCADTAREKAKNTVVEHGDSVLKGIPVAVKDNICTEGVKTTCASRMLENYVPPYSATVYKKLENAGAIMLGKTNMDEFAMGSTTENSYFKKVKNPDDITRVPGGSSGGSAAAVAAKEAPYALGSDTGGSIRQPAAFCGVVGVKPTYGTISRKGLIAFASSLDQIGPLSKNVKDAALILDAISGKDPGDATSCESPASFSSEIGKDIKGKRLALPREFFGKGISDDVKNAVLGAAKKFEELGAFVDEVSLPSLDNALPAYYLISSAEASSNLSRFDGARYGYRSDAHSYEDGEFDASEFYKTNRSEGFGDEVKRRIMLGTFALSAGYYDAYYKKALRVRALLRKEFSSVFENHAAIIAPVTPTTAYKLGSKTQNPLEMYMGDIYTVPVSIAGLPAVSIPCGRDGDGMSIGLQIIGDSLKDAERLGIAHSF